MAHEAEWVEHMRREFWKRMMKNPTKCSRMEWKNMSGHPFLTESMIANNPDHPWDWRALSRQEFIKIHRSLLQTPEKDWDWIHLSSTIPLEFILQHPRLGWSYSIVYDRMHPRRTIPPRRIEILLATTPGNELDWKTLSMTAPLSFILSHATLSWKWHLVTRRQGVSFRILHHHPNLNWDLKHAMRHLPFSSHHLTFSRFLLDFPLLSLNPHLHRHILCRHLDRPWDWKALARHPAFPPQKIYHDTVLRPLWRWDHCLLHPRISWEFYNIARREFTITRHFSLLSKNHFHASDILPPYLRAVLHRFLLTTLYRRRLHHQFRLLRYIRNHLPSCLFQLPLLQFV